jgi:hypothetical protein
VLRGERILSEVTGRARNRVYRADVLLGAIGEPVATADAPA